MLTATKMVGDRLHSYMSSVYGPKLALEFLVDIMIRAH